MEENKENCASEKEKSSYSSSSSEGLELKSRKSSVFSDSSQEPEDQNQFEPNHVNQVAAIAEPVNVNQMEAMQVDPVPLVEAVV